MEISKVKPVYELQTHLIKKELLLSSDELTNLTNFFFVLITIDQKNKKKGETRHESKI